SSAGILNVVVAEMTGLSKTGRHNKAKAGRTHCFIFEVVTMLFLLDWFFCLSEKRVMNDSTEKSCRESLTAAASGTTAPTPGPACTGLLNVAGGPDSAMDDSISHLATPNGTNLFSKPVPRTSRIPLQRRCGWSQSGSARIRQPCRRRWRYRPRG